MSFHRLTNTQFKVFKQAVLILFLVPVLKSNYVSIFQTIIGRVMKGTDLLTVGYCLTLIYSAIGYILLWG